MTKKVYGTVLLKAVQILDVMSQRTTSLSMTEISKYTGITLPTTNKILDTLELTGLVSRDSITKEYSLGPRLIQMANASFIQFDIVRESYTPLKHLYEIVGTTVNLGMLESNQVLFLNKFSDIESSQKVASRIGFSQPLYCTAMGKAMLSEFTEDELNDYFEEVELAPLTGNTILSKEKLIEEIERTRERGYAIDDCEAEENVFCIGTTFRVPGSKNKFAFSISSQFDDINESRLEFLLNELKKNKTVLEYQFLEL